MSLPALRLSTSLSWPVLRDLVPRLREHLAGQVLALPAALGERELAEALDAVALLTAWPVRLLGSAEESGGDAVLLVPETPAEIPAAVPGAVVVCSMAHVPGVRRLDLPPELFLLRDAVADLVGRSQGSGPLARAAAWVADVADTPRLAVQFLDGVWRQLLANGHPDKEPPAFRRGLAVLQNLGEMPGKPTWRQLSEAIGGTLPAEALAVLDRLARPKRDPLGLLGPNPPPLLLGRDEEVRRLTELLTPGPTMPVVILYGPGGSGRTALASTVSRTLSARLEPVWVPCFKGPAEGWAPVASALGLEPSKVPDGFHLDELGRPRWLLKLFERIREEPILFVLEGTDEIAEEVLPDWIPSGAGRGAVLVLSPLSQRPLQQRYEAVAVRLGPLPREEARAFLTRFAPDWREEIAAGEADGLIDLLGGHAGALRVAADALGKGTIKDLETRVREGGADPAVALARAAVAGLGKEERAVVEALAVAAPGGTLAALVGSVAKVKDVERVLDRLADRGLIQRDGRSVRLIGIARLGARVDLSKQQWQALEKRHAAEALRRFEEAKGKDESWTVDALAKDLVHAMGVLPDHPRSGMELTVGISYTMNLYRRGEVRENQERCAFALRRIRKKRWITKDLRARAARALGRILIDLPCANPNSARLEAITMFKEAGAFFTRDQDPVIWGHLQNELGAAYNGLTVGGTDQNQAEAQRAYECASSVFQRTTHPNQWAALQNNLGTLLLDLNVGDRRANLRKAVGYIESAIEIQTSDENKESIATSRINLALALSHLSEFDGPSRIEEAIHLCGVVIETCDRDTYPEGWGRAQQALGTCYALLPDPSSKKLAREAYEKSLSVHSREGYPTEWAETNMDIGELCLAREGTSHPSALLEAIDRFKAALSIYTAAGQPTNWARAEYNLGTAISELPEGHPERIEHRAIAAFEAFQQVFQRDWAPELWATAMSQIGRLHRQLADRNNTGRADQLSEAILAFSAAANGLRTADKEEDALQAEIELAYTQILANQSEAAEATLVRLASAKLPPKLRPGVPTLSLFLGHPWSEAAAAAEAYAALPEGESLDWRWDALLAWLARTRPQDVSRLTAFTEALSKPRSDASVATLETLAGRQDG